ncbi:MAG: nucleotidyltransferase family protein [Myxococcales bacterium]|nr:nucleotidyltransferase family protein [Myxococcales bacterium]
MSMPPLSPEAAALVKACRDWLAGRALAPLPAGVVAFAEQHRLAGALHHLGAPMAAGDAALAERAWAQNLAGHLARVGALGRLWPVSAPPPLVFKGADIGERLFDDPGARAANDLDLLLPSPDFEAVDAALAGLRRRPAPRTERFAGEPPHAIGLATDDVLIELHREPQPPHRARLRAAEVYARAEAGRLGAVNVRWPTSRDRLLLWLTNQAKDAFHSDLAALLDLALILCALGGEQAPLSVLRAEACEAGLGRSFDLGRVRLHQSGLWPWALPLPKRRSVWRVARALPDVHTGRREPNQARFQAIKLWLCAPAARFAVLLRGAATVMRGGRPGPGR